MVKLELEKLNKNKNSLSNGSLIFALISGILLFLSFPQYGSGFIAWIALVPLFHAIKDRTFSDSLLFGFIAGAVYYVGIIYWVVYAIFKYGNLPIYTAILAMLLLSAYLSIYVAFFSAGINYFKKKKIPLLFSAPIIWTSLEYIKSIFLTGFPWENLAYSQFLNIKIIQLADMTGTYGISFLIVFINAVIYQVLFDNLTKKKIIFNLCIAVLIIFLVYGYGVYRVSTITGLMNDAKAIEVNLIQGNIDQGVKWDEAYRQKSVETYKKLSLKYSIKSRGLIVWPETAVPFYFQNADNYRRAIIEVAISSNNWLLIGSPSYVKENNTYAVSNSAFLISPEGEVKGQYDKVHLVPFGEYVPLRKYFPFIDKLVFGIGDFRAGSGYHPLQMDQLELGVLICYEGIFPEAGRKYKNENAQLLVNITNDAWYGRTSAPYQHLSMVILRSIENRLYTVRAANTGISAIIDATGAIVSNTDLFETTSLQGSVKILNTKTFYSIFGDVFAYICLAGLILLLLTPTKKGGR